MVEAWCLCCVQGCRALHLETFEIAFERLEDVVVFIDVCFLRHIDDEGVICPLERCEVLYRNCFSRFGEQIRASLKELFDAMMVVSNTESNLLFAGLY